ncbi:timeless protein domain-containing protein [Phthorimaea operculella]|nr:timeless protein domain-containing protein [Phthorimaea operculella]
MEWVLRSPEIHTTFGNLGYSNGDGYHINENCSSALETILHNILSEDKYLRTYRRSISFGQNINKDLIPLLLNAKDDKLIVLLVKILVNLTIPIECLLSVEVISKTEYGRHTIFEINNLLSTTKAAFTDNRATKAVVEFLKKNLDAEQTGLSDNNCANISNSLLLFRNILHIPEETSNAGNAGNAGHNSTHTVQNQILWNMFSHSIDKILIKLMTISEASNWGVTMVQLIALLYKDQHVVTLHKLLNLWLEASVSESSEDNESNTSPPDRGSEDSSPMLTSDPTSDSSDTGASGKGSNEDPNSAPNQWDADKGDSIGTSIDGTEKSDQSKDQSSSNDSTKQERDTNETSKKDKKAVQQSENSDCGYGTQIENQESISTSSNEDDLPSKKVVHQKPQNPKQRVNTKARISAVTSLQEKKRKKLVKRGKSNIINVQGLSHKTPTDDDISNILKDFTVDFLLKGYNHIVHTLHSQILTNMQLEIDISHFFWLVTYFLKFATQIELDLEHVCSVLSYDVITFLSAEGVNLCEQFELAVKLDENNLKPSIRRLHLVVTAVREFVHAIEGYKKFPHLCSEDKAILNDLQFKMCETGELRDLLVLLLRHYNPKYHTKQYLQDIIVTNHILLIFLDNVMKMPEYEGTGNMTDHIKQFATPGIMYQYGLLLEDYTSNGEFVNDCCFTMMHHVGGELGCLVSLFQPKILKIFTSIWKTEFEICDDWSDLIEYVINTFIKKPESLQSASSVVLDNESFSGDRSTSENPFVAPFNPGQSAQDADNRRTHARKTNSRTTKDRWSKDELSSLSWNYLQCKGSADAVDEIVNLFKEDGITKTRESVIRQLYKQKLITKSEYDTASKGESERNTRMSKEERSKESMRDDDINKLCDQLTQDGNRSSLEWVQQVLLDTCFAKICLEKKAAECLKTPDKNEVKLLTFEFFKEKAIDLPVVSPVSYHSLISNKSVPLVPWNCGQAAICKDLRFLQLLHKLGFHMPVDTGKVFIRIPHFWSADVLYEIAGKVAPVDTTKLKFLLNDIKQKGSVSPSSSATESYLLSPSPSPAPALNEDDILMPSPDTLYQIHKQKHLAMMNYTPMYVSYYRAGEQYLLSPSPSPAPALNEDDILMPSPDTLYQIHKQKHLAMMNYTPMYVSYYRAGEQYLLSPPPPRPPRAQRGRHPDAQPRHALPDTQAEAPRHDELHAHVRIIL